jgi:predicted  nucleic acid-binding Zn-ribbon protein
MKKLFKGKSNAAPKEDDQSEEGLFEQARTKFKTLKKNVSYFLDSLKKYDKAVRALSKPVEELSNTTREFCEGDTWPVGEQIAAGGSTFSRALDDFGREMDRIIEEIRSYEQKLSEMQKKINERDKVLADYKDKQKALVAAKKDPAKEATMMEKLRVAREIYEAEHKSTMTELTLLLNNRIIDFEKYFRAFAEAQLKLWCAAMNAYRLKSSTSLPSSSVPLLVSSSSSFSSASPPNAASSEAAGPLPPSASHAVLDATLPPAATSSVEGSGPPPPLPSRERAYTLPVSSTSPFVSSDKFANESNVQTHSRQSSDSNAEQTHSSVRRLSVTLPDANGPPRLPPRASQKFASVPVDEPKSNPPPLPSRENRPKLSQVTATPNSLDSVSKASTRKVPTYPLPPQSSAPKLRHVSPKTNSPPHQMTAPTPSHSALNSPPHQTTTPTPSHSVSSPSSLSSSSPPPTTTPPSQSSTSPLDIPPEERQKYAAIFRREDPSNTGYITGAHAYTLFSRSGLSKDELAQIWDLADQDVDGKLDIEEFILAMFLINSKLMGRITTIPHTLPPNLIIKK